MKINFIVDATSNNTLIQFGVNGGFRLDDISVTPLQAQSPAFQNQPQQQTVSLGTNATLRAVAAGTPPLHYQWQFNGANLVDGGRISGSQTSTLSIAGVLGSDLGNYQLMVTNDYGSTNSVVAKLTLPPECVNLWSGLRGWWRAEDNALDMVSTNSGVANGVGYTNGVVGMAFSWDEYSEGSVLLPTLNLNGNTAMTLESWIKPTLLDTKNAPILRQFSEGDYETNDWLITFQQNGSLLTFGLNAGNSYEELKIPVIPAQYQDGKWHHIAATYDGSVKRLYRDGVEIGSAPKTGRINSSATDRQLIGEGPDHIVDHFYGLVDELAIFDRALSPAEIQSIYDAGSSGKCVNRPPPNVEAVLQSDGTILFTWNAEPEFRYQLQSSSSLSEPGWTGSGSILSGGTSTLSTSAEIGSDPTMFYRVVVVP
jgi:hypothetical protein